MDPVLAQLVEHLTVVVYFPGIKWSLVQIQQTGFFIYIFNTYKNKLLRQLSPEFPRSPALFAALKASDRSKKLLTLKRIHQIFNKRIQICRTN